MLKLKISDYIIKYYAKPLKVLGVFCPGRIQKGEKE